MDHPESYDKESKRPAPEDVTSSNTERSLKKPKLKSLDEFRIEEESEDKKYTRVLHDFYDRFEEELFVGHSMKNAPRIRDISTMNLLKLAYKTSCTNTRIITRVLLAHLRKYGYISIQPFTTKLYIESIMNENRVKDFLQWENHNYNTIISKALLRGHCFLMQFLAKYGKCIFSFDEDMMRQPDEEYALLTPSALRNFNLCGIAIENMIKQQAPPTQRFTVQDTDFGFQRLGMILVALDIVDDFCSDQTTIEHSDYELNCQMRVHCLNLLIETTTEPYITYTDIEKYLMLYFQDTQEDTASLDVLKTVFPNMKSTYEPRSLKHLSRCKIRDCLQGSIPFTEGVSKLKLPKLLQKFTLFENVTIEDIMLREEDMDDDFDFDEFCDW